MKYLIVLLLLVGCDKYQFPLSSKIFGPKFKVGDCVKYKDFDEFKFNIVKKIKGTLSGYYHYGYGENYELHGISKIQLIDSNSIQVDCENNS